MDVFTSAYLANLTANLSAHILPKAARRLQAAWQGGPSDEALRRCLQAGIYALVSKASSNEPEHEALLGDIFNDFFQDEAVANKLLDLVWARPLNMEELRYLFTEAGFDPETLPGLDFSEAIAAFEAAFLETAALETALQPAIQVQQGWAQTALQQEMVKLLRPVTQSWQQLAGQPLGIQAGNIIAQNVVSGTQHIETQINIYQWPAGTLPDSSARTTYLTWLMAERGTLPLRAISSGKTGGQERPPELAKVYVALNTKITIEPGKKWSQEIRRSLEEQQEDLPALTAVASQKRLILLGDPGSGKSTFVSHLAYCLAAHALQPHDDWLEQLPGWPVEAAGYLPVLVILRDFSRWLPQPTPARAHARHLWNFITETLEEEKLAGVIPFFETAVAEGQALLMLDGLDEVTSDDQRRFVRDAVLAFARRYPKCRLLLTCRILSYRDPDPEKEEADLRLPAGDYPTIELAAFNEAQRDTFVKEWYRELKRQGHLPGLDETRLSLDLQRAIRRSDLRRVAGNPLLLTVMAMVHVDEGRLPDSRALLYEKTIDLLLLRWEENKSEDEVPLLRQLLQEANRTDVDLKARLAEVAFQVHTQAGTATDIERVADIGEAYLCQELGRLNKKDLGWGQRLLAAIKTRAGLLVERSPGQFAFPHRTFQEYLAGAHLAARPDFPEQALEWGQRDPGWWPMVLFAVEYLVYVTPRMYEPLKLLSLLCPEEPLNLPAGWRLVWLAGEVLLSLGLERAGDSEWGQELAGRVRRRLATLLEEGHLSPQERAEAGNVLSMLGDPRPGVGFVVHEEHKIPDIAWGEEVPAGSYPYQGTTVIISQPYRLARYPITYAQYQCFTKAQDFREPDWWKGMPPLVKDWDDKEYPVQELAKQAFPLANRPRETVSWYQAVAFGRWLDYHLKRAGLVAAEERIDLPHEDEWEVAARYAGHGQVERRLYPWGDEAITADYANYRDTGLGETSAVGLFPAGRQAELDLYDLSGNVWEWCRNKFDNPEETAVDQSNDPRTLRGGSWRYNSNPLRAAYRNYNNPNNRNYNSGFRLVRRFPSHPDH